MKIRDTSKAKKIAVGVSAACIILSAVIGMAVWLHAKNNTPPPTISCFAHGSELRLWPDSLQDFADQSYGIVIGTVLNEEVLGMSSLDNSPPPRLLVTDVIKGQALHKGDVLQLCPVGPIDFTDDNHTLLVFLEGKDNDVWLPNWENDGMIPQSKDGRFKQKWGNGSKTSATVGELKQLIK